MGKWWKQSQTLFFWSPESLQNNCSHEIKRHLLLGRKVTTNLDSIIKSRDITLLTKYGFSSSHVWMWELNHKEGWASKNWCFWTVVLDKSLESLLDCKEVQSVNPKGNQSWRSNTWATWCKELTHLKSPWCWGRNPLWFLTPLGWAREEERGQKPERSYLTEMVVNLFLLSSLLWHVFQIDSCGLLLWAVLKSFCFSLHM